MNEGRRKKYSNQLKKRVCQDVCINNKSTIKTAQKFSVCLKTMEKWITAFNKDPHCFDQPDNYLLLEREKAAHRFDEYSKEDLISLLKHKDSVIDYLNSVLIANNIRFENIENNRGSKNG